MRLETFRLGFPWLTFDPFLFCVHHNDAYPKGNGKFGPAADLSGRQIGQDFQGKDGWNMYHGESVPGFPQHPHRGFETVTVVRRGLIDHSDSMGAAARYGDGDVQWLTAGHGIVHAEMFPLLDTAKPNPVELFQIWLNLPGDNKLVDPHFAMFWAPNIPKRTLPEAKGGGVEITVIAGTLGDAQALSPPPNSWAARPNSHVAIWTIKLQPNARWVLPAGVSGLNRALYLFAGQEVRIDDGKLSPPIGLKVPSDRALTLENGPSVAEILVLQGRPIGEPVVQYGPFVMQSRAQIQQAFDDYRRTQFGGWPWPSDDPVHGAERRRFARRPDGKTETPPT